MGWGGRNGPVTHRGACLRGLRAMAAVGLLGLAACTGPAATSGGDADGTGPGGLTTGAAAPNDAPGGAAGPGYVWSPVSLPQGSSPLTLTPMRDALLVGALAPAAGATPPAPLLLTLAGDGTATPIPLTPGSGYAREARWYSVVTDGTRIVAIGGATGGAHGNVRWSTWDGTAAGVGELTQNFLTFGGEAAGQLLDAVLTPAGPVLVGTWEGARAGQDAAIWLPDGPIWRRQDSAGTALESTPVALVGPRAAVSFGPGVLVAGSVVRLGPGAVSQGAALWRSSAPDRGWQRIDLPDAGRRSEAVALRCDGLECTAVGQVDGALAAWEIHGDAADRIAGLPLVRVSDDDPIPAPLELGGRLVIVAPGAASAEVLTRSGTTGPGWQVATGPPGRPVRAVVVGDRLYVTSRPDARSVSHLWSGQQG